MRQLAAFFALPGFVVLFLAMAAVSTGMQLRGWPAPSSVAALR